MSLVAFGSSSAEGLSPLLADLHRGPFDAPLWSSFLARLSGVTEADHVNLTFRRLDAPMNELTSFLHQNRRPGDFHSRYLTEHYRRDPLPYHSLELGRVYGLQELLSGAGEAGASWARDYLQVAGIDNLRIMRVTEPSGYTAWLTIARAGEKDFGPEHAALLSGLAEHLSIALQAFAALETTRRLQGLYEAALRRLSVGVLTLDGAGRILSSNETAAQLLADGAMMRADREGRLRLRSAVAQRGLQRSLEEFLAHPQAPHRTLRLSEEPRREILLRAVPDRPASGPHTPVLTIYVQGELATLHRAEGLMALYGLTRTEAKLALAITDGLTIAAAAAKTGITEESARTYTKRIYQKTGVARQAELVRAVFMSLLILP